MERSLVERARDGDRDAFEALVRARVDSVYRTAFTILGNAADAQDATQEAFISAWRAFPRLKDPDRIRGLARADHLECVPDVAPSPPDSPRAADAPVGAGARGVD